ncbi:LysM peptidoglycan-binding domain-containing protein [Lactiplantibacillus pentosus]|nr:NlpC/P60 family protein [Lactiplantibacillus pentosus]ASG81301.1 gamma-D-glutamyl-meso-diaminopimelate peptidase [Lactiplantibacillus pentosus]MBO9165139.1 C40 family peptidase [Lactiplantibacillus pentosus]MBU7477276.1 C40 family peptidase [Lactiplantibacillus pentosus]MBU7534563.1 C40 family peptidase [Lactiplantibacillus pentosus]MCT3276340.1 LysM peptidoglycan-binding domain-containing protein [Lactiplantibacillus pentosus]
MKYIRDILFGVIIIKVKVNIKQVMLGTAALAGMLVTSQAVANADSMTIKAGDTVWAYSQKYHVSVNKIAEANGLSNPDLIIAGKTINIPGVKTGEKVTTKTTTASASSAKSTSAATSTSQAASSTTSAAATSSSTTSASSTSQAVSSSSTAAQSSSTSTASASSVTSSASSSSVASQASSSSATSTSSASQSSASQSSASQASSASTSTTATSTQSAAATSTSSQASSSASTTSSSSTTTSATAYSASATSSSTSTTSSSTTGSASALIAAAETYLGTPYEQMDCSAFTQAAFAKIGRTIGRTTYAQATLGTHVSFSSAQAGDLIFWGSDSAPYHVGIYLGNGKYIASPTEGETVSIKSTTYYTPSFAIHMF